MWMVVGLGNPGREHEEQRHNAGFLVVDRLAERAGARLSDKKFKGRLGRGRVANDDVLLLEPQTYMNLSGESVGPALGFYKLPTDQLIVIHDELELPFGTIAVKQGGGHGGHNGLRSLKKHLPNDRFVRVRFGIGRPPAQWDPADWVLSRFSSEERGQLDSAIDAAVDATETIVTDGVSRALNTFKPNRASARTSKAGRPKRAPTRDAPGRGLSGAVEA